jgi:Trk K+ transport system NAD-binding subunit
MNSVVFLILRRMRAPLVVLIVIYAISILGLTLISGVDAAGKVAPPLSFFHAFYFVSYTATTIGFGEIPTAFSEGQRLWVTICIYLTVIGWSYSVVTLLALLQDKAFQNVLVYRRFVRRVRQMQEPFYLVCGCGETGALVCRALDHLDIRFVVIEAREERVQELDLEDFKSDAPALAADARLPQILQIAGLSNPKCRGVLALTNDDNSNLAIAIAARLLTPRTPVLARVEHASTAANMASFGTHHIINPYASFASYLGLAITAPHQKRLQEWLTGLAGQTLSPPSRPPQGKWVVCGHGRFGKPLIATFDAQQQQVCIIDPAPPGDLQHPHVQGQGTEAETLLAAGIREAVGLIAGTDNDINNLSIVMTARDLNPGLYTVVRQNQMANAPLFAAFDADATMIPSQVVAHEALAIITTPLLSRFISESRHICDENWAATACERFTLQFDNCAPYFWRIEATPKKAPALYTLLKNETVIAIDTLLRDYRDRETRLDMLVMMLLRDGECHFFPNIDTPLKPGDALLVAGEAGMRDAQEIALQNLNVLNYLLTGNEHAGGYLWQKLFGQKQ